MAKQLREIVNINASCNSFSPIVTLICHFMPESAHLEGFIRADYLKGLINIFLKPYI